MANVKPFHGIRYDSKIVGDLARVLSPPYDVIDDAGEKALLERNPHNIIRVELSHTGVDGHASEEKYRAAGETLEAWLADGVLVRESEPAFYVYAQRYTGPDGKTRERLGFFGRVQLEDPGEGGSIRPHETTLGGPKADRLRLISATRTNVSPIFGLFDDPTGRVSTLLRDTLSRTPDATATDDDDITHRLWVVTDGPSLDTLSSALAERKIYIADGHHRYATALNYQRQRRDSDGNAPPMGEAGYDSVMMFLADINDPGLAVFPIHRVVRTPEGFDAKGFLESLAPLFNVERIDGGNGPAAATAITQGLAEEREQRRRAVAAYGEAIGGAYLLRARTAELDAFLAKRQVPPPLAALDITVLHTAILEPMQISFENGLSFAHDASDAIARVDDGACDLAFLLNATRVEDLVTVVEAGLTMPQKSTFFYPKPATGLVLNRLD